MNRFTRILLIATIMMVMPVRHWAQQPQFTQNQTSITFDITDISIFDERIFFIYNLMNDSRFDVIIGEEDGTFIVKADEAFDGLDLQQTFTDFRAEMATQFAIMDKMQASETAIALKSQLPDEYVMSLMMDFYVRSRTNNTCATSDPFCTDNGMYQFPAGVNAGSGESGPYYDCLSTTPNPAWYHMRIANPGSITIHMESSPSHDIDFCCWGPFTDPISPCPNGLTSNKVVSCSYSIYASENCIIPSSAQTGDYFILVITNYSNQSCNISFSKTAGTGTTDCGIMPPVVDNDGPYCVGETINLTANGQAGASYSWAGPGGFTSTQQNPTRPNCTMAMAGTYTCTITLGGATNSATTDVVVYPQPTANFTATSVCQGEATQFTSTSTTNPSGQNITSYQWDFGDSQTSTQQNPSHTYTNAGTYTVTLTVGCGNGHCTDTKTQTVTVYAAPAANAGPDQTIGYGGTAQLSGQGGTGSFNYHWEPANMVVNANAQNTQTVSLTQDQTYTLTVTNPQGGCSSTDEVTIHINGSAMSVSANATPSSICQGSSTQLQANAGGGTGNFTYSWTPTTGLNNASIYNPTASPTQTTTYSCTVSDGQTTQTVSVTVTVNMPEYTEETHYICPGDTYEWHDQIYSDEGNYEYHTTTAQGCEKIITLHLHHYPTSDETTIDTAICYGEDFNFFGTSYNYSIYNLPHTLYTSHGCDSIVRLNLTVYEDNGITPHPQTVCPSQLPFYYEEDPNQIPLYAGDHIFHLTDRHGCDSTVVVSVTVSDYYIPPVQSVYTCEPSFTWDVNGVTYYHDNNQVQQTIHEIDTLPYADCEGIFELKLHFHDAPELEEFTEVACNHFDWYVDGNWVGRYETSDNYTYTVPLYEDPNNPSTQYPCNKEYLLHLTVNYESLGNSVVADGNTTRICDCYSYFNEWVSGDTITFCNDTSIILNGSTPDDCDYSVNLQIKNMKYTPQPVIKCSDLSVQNPDWPITATEFNVNRYTYYASDPKSDATWINNQCEWKISKESWPIVPSDDNRSCIVYAMDWVPDSICLSFKAVSPCSEEGEIVEYWLKPSFYSIDEQEAYPASVDIIPNPNNGQMQLRIENMEGKLDVKVYNLSGMLTDDFVIHADQIPYTHNYAMKRLSNGVYFFVITDGKRSLTKKVVIIH